MLRTRRSRIFLAAAALLLAAVLLGSRYWLGDLPSLDRPLADASAPSILIDDRSGRLLYEIIDPNGSKQVPLALSDIPLACQQATIATEDSHFYQHPGVDPVAIVRALWQNWREGETVSGGSTLTQQIARNLYLAKSERNEQSLRRKLREAWLAWRLERAYDKPELLALYLNTTYYGHFAVGIEAAGQAYFGMHARELDLAQCALLAGLPQYPAGYNPIENPDAARARQKTVLGLMTEDGYISQAQADDAHKEAMAYTSTPFPIEAPHFVMWVLAQLESSLGQERLRQGGLVVTTTLDLDWQKQAEAIVNRRLAQLRPCAAGAPVATCDPAASPSRRVDDAALVAMDPATGAVLAMVGSADYFDRSINGAVNATLSMRQPGSAIKPLTYAAAFDPARAAAAGRQPWTPATLISDVRTVFPTQENKPYVPQNYDLRFHGPVTARTALANSYNIPAVKTLQHIGVDGLIEQAERAGIVWTLGGANVGTTAPVTGTTGTDTAATLPIANAGPLTAGLESPGQPPARFGLALTLGGGEVRLLDLTAAYGAFANGGRRVTPYAISAVKTLGPDDQRVGEWGSGGVGDMAEGDATVSQHKPGQQAVDPRVAYLITSILSDEDARVPAFGPGNLLEIGRPAAAKTGTTTDWRDNWTVGYTPEVVTGVWVGNPDNTPMLDISGITGAGPIWHDFMVSVLRDTPPSQFSRPDGLVQVEVCADSGLLPLPAEQTPGNVGIATRLIPCPSRRLEWFIEGTEPTQVDRMHERLAIDVRTGGVASTSTPAEYVGNRSYWVLPPEYREWARENGVEQPAPVTGTVAGAASGGTNRGDATGAGTQDQGPGASVPALSLASPDPNRSYRLDPTLPAEAQKLPVTAVPGPALDGSSATITLLLDGSPVAALHAPDYTEWWQLAPGRHTFQAITTAADGSRVTSGQVTIEVEQPGG